MRPLVSALLLAAACQQPALRQVPAGIEVSPPALDFGETWLGASPRREVTVRNGSKAPAHVVVTVGAPFSAGAELTLGPVEASALEVRFAPAATGPSSATLRLVPDEGEPVEVSLAGAGVDVPACPEAPVCRTIVADVEAQACVEGFVADGTACTSSCLTGGGTCVQGSCVGTPISCDDSDVCTVDFCDPVGGCGHAARECPSPSDPCKAGACNPRLGCVFADAPDGTRCGDGDCVTSHVCLQGACVVKPTPGGASCGDTSPCRAAGTCQNQVCEQPPASDLAPVWTVTPAPGRGVVFPGLADRAGNLYWFEDAELVSVDRNGTPRYRVAMSFSPVSGGLDELSPAMLASDTTLVAFSRTGGILEARRTSDGAKLWSLDRARIQELFRIATTASGPWVIAIAENAGGEVVANLRSNAGGAAWTSWIASFDRLTGALRWSRQYDYLDELVADSSGNVYTYVDLWEHRLVSIGPTGQERYNLLVGSSAMPGAAPPVMAVDAMLLTGSGAVLRDITTGAVTSTPPSLIYVQSSWGPPPAMSSSRLVLADQSSICSTGVQSFGLPAFGQQWSWSEPEWCVKEASLTDRGTVFVSAVFHNTRGVRLLEVDAQGQVAWSCHALANSADALPVLLDGRWVVFDWAYPRILAFDVPGARLANKGWVSAFGGNARNQRQR